MRSGCTRQRALKSGSWEGEAVKGRCLKEQEGCDDGLGVRRIEQQFANLAAEPKQEACSGKN